MYQSSLKYDYDFMKDFRSVFQENVQAIESLLIELEHKNSDNRKFTKLKRCVRNMKSDLDILEMESISELVTSVEKFLDSVEERKIRLDPRVSDLILLLSHRIKSLFERIFDKKNIDQHNVSELINGLNNLSHETHFVEGTNRLLALLDPQLRPIEHSNNEKHGDLGEFRNLARFMETRSWYSFGSTDRIMQTALGLNKTAGNPVDMEQLKTAAYVHDVGMGFISVDINKAGRLTAAEKNALHQHPGLAAQFLLNFKGWDPAAEMVHQHHERYDGSGYPDGLTGTRICDGAKILSIADTFESMSHAKAHRMYKRPLLRIIAEINSNSAGQFDPFWVGIFNQYIRQHIQ